MECQCVDIYVICFMGSQCVECVLCDSWSASVLIYMLSALWGLSALNVYYMTHGVSVCLFSVLNVCCMTHGVSIC